ncbi:hypothetical protein SEA_NICEHOUSE_242 [Rhodococcus phage NiceHouse]|nr:hypothetical protein SEA_NICEHOUSE_242 [Rhodococcus phage NiceHouse]
MSDRLDQSIVDFILDTNYLVVRAISNGERRIDMKIPVNEDALVIDLTRKVAKKIGYKAVTEREDDSEILSFYLFEDK